MQNNETYSYRYQLFICSLSKAQQKLTLAQQQEDLKIFKTSMQEMHAGVYWFIAPERFSKLYDSVYTTLRTILNLNTFL